MYLHIDRTTSKILKFSPLAPTNPNLIGAVVPKELGDELQLGNTSTISNYFVLLHANGKVTVELNEGSQVKKDTGLIEIQKLPGAELSIIVDTGRKMIQFVLSSKVKKDAQIINIAVAEDAPKRCVLYFTKKNDPLHLLFTINIVVDDLLSAPNQSIGYPIDAHLGQISVYTKPILNSYSLEIL